MSVDVRVPTVLRSYTGGASVVSVDGGTVSEVLDGLDATYSGIKGRIVDEQGDIRRFINIYVGNEDVRGLQGLATPTPRDTRISVIPAVAGGCH